MVLRKLLGNPPQGTCRYCYQKTGFLTDIGDVPSIGPMHFKELPSLESLQIEGEGENPIKLNQTSVDRKPNGYRVIPLGAD